MTSLREELVEIKRTNGNTEPLMSPACRHVHEEVYQRILRSG